MRVAAQTSIQDAPAAHGRDASTGQANACAHEHSVQFFETDERLCSVVGRYIREGLAAGDAAMVIASAEHRDGILRALEREGIDGRAAALRGQLILLDAAETLGRFMIGDGPDRDRFLDTIEPILDQLSIRFPRTRAFGEMVNLLWLDEKKEAALRLEELWEELTARRNLSLLCAYAFASYLRRPSPAELARIAAVHTKLLGPSEVAGDGEDVGLGEVPATGRDGAAVRDSLRAEIGLRREVERALRHSMATVAAANRAKDDFLAVLSHELRTPLTAMMAWISLLRGGKLDAANAARALDVIERSGRAQTRLINDILDVSRIVAGKLSIETRPIERLGPIVTAAVDAARPAAGAKELTLEVELAPDDGPLLGDAARLQQVASNLLVNAIKFTPRGGRVRVETARVDGEVELRVTDTGIGIDAGFLPHVFERFQQADTTSARMQGGLGLGLAIVHSLVGLHGGTIRAESAGADQGSTFVVRLARAQGSKLLLDEAAPASDRQSGRPRRLLEDVRILVVEDDPDTRDVIALLLDGTGASVKATAFADEALSLVASWKPGSACGWRGSGRGLPSPLIVLTDIGLPGKDGYDLIRRIRALGGERVAMAALTGYAGTENRRKALAAGFEDHVAKPIDPDELITVLTRLAGR